MANGFKEAAFIGFSGASYIERRPVINLCPYHWQTDGDVYARLESEDLYRPIALIVVHGYHQVEVAAVRDRRACQRAAGPPRSSHGCDTPGLPARSFPPLHRSEEAILSGVRICAADPNVQILVNALNSAQLEPPGVNGYTINTTKLVAY